VGGKVKGCVHVADNEVRNGGTTLSMGIVAR